MSLKWQGEEQVTMVVQSNTAMDLVYTWVDGADLAWQAEKERYAHEAGYFIGNRNCRWQDNEELRYSLRSVAAYWPYEGTIYIVTAGQTPAWLNTEHPRIRVVDHREIIPSDYLPTFSSTAIIARLHHIHGLRERYLYLNDDFFFLRPVQEQDFYEGESSLFYVNDKRLDDANQLSENSHSDQNGVVFSRAFMQREFGVTDAFPMPEHAPKAMQRSRMVQLEKQFPALFHDAMRGRFRRADAPIIDDLFFRWLHHLGRAQYRQNRNCYMENCVPDAAEQYAALLEGRHDALCLCINDISDDMPEAEYAPYQQQMQAFLVARFPEKSDFERD
ncbi:stealth family protein [Kistimonas scapharcae]